MIRNRALVALLVAALCAAGCGSHANEGHHPAAGSSTPAAAPPTPDTTPIETLRTPAGLVLKIDAPTPTPASPTPAPSK